MTVINDPLVDITNLKHGVLMMLLLFSLEGNPILHHRYRLMLLLLNLPLVDAEWQLLLRLDKWLDITILLNKQEFSLFSVGLLVRYLIITFSCLPSENMIDIFLHIVLFHTQVLASWQRFVNAIVLHEG